MHCTDPVLHVCASIVVRSYSHNGNHISVSPCCMFFSLTTPSQGLLETIGLDALCYIVLLLMPVLGRMSDQQQEVRHMASRCFAVLVSYMPLEVRYSIDFCLRFISCKFIEYYMGLHTILDNYQWNAYTLSLYLVWGNQSTGNATRVGREEKD